MLIVGCSNGSKAVTCSSTDVECEYDDNNLINTLFQVPTLDECRQNCIDEDDCEYITYFNASAFPIPKECRVDSTNLVNL